MASGYSGKQECRMKVVEIIEQPVVAGGGASSLILTFKEWQARAFSGASQLPCH